MQEREHTAAELAKIERSLFICLIFCFVAYPANIELEDKE